jgi:CRP-like cAMP-binding protein
MFQGLQRRAVARIAGGTHAIAAPRGTVLFRRGDPCEGLHVVVSGQIKLVLPAAPGHEKVLDLAGPGESFGEAAMFLGRPHLATAVAIADSRLLHVARQSVLEALERDPRLARRVIASLSRRLDRFMSELEAVSTRTGTERVVEFLMKQLPPRRRINSCTAMLPASKGIIASQLNLTHEHFSRLLHNLSAAGLISVAGRRIRILDIGRLRGYAS